MPTRLGAGFGTVSIERRGAVRDASPNALLQFGRQPAEVIGELLRNLLAAHARPAFDRFLQDLLSGVEANVATAIERPQASELAVSIDSAGEYPAGCFELRIAEVAASPTRGMSPPSDRVAHAIADAVPSMVAYWNRDLVCEFANASYREWFGRRADEVVGLTLPRLLGPELFGMNEPYVREALRGELQGFERTLTRADGTIGHTWAQYVPDVVDGVTRGFLAIVTDISAVKAAEIALRASEARFREVLDVSPVPQALSDGEMRVTYVNPAFVRTFGYDLEDVPTLEAWWSLAFPDPGYRRVCMDRRRQGLEAARHSALPPAPPELLVRCQDGTTKSVLAYGGILQGPAEGACVDILVDVTEQRRLEQRMLDAASREQSDLGLALHEGLSQDLAAVALLLDGVAARSRGPECLVNRDDLATLAETARRCVATSRSIAEGLSPVELGSGGLGPALERLATLAAVGGGPAIEVELRGFGAHPIEPAFAETVYRIAQDLWSSAGRRSGATRLALAAELDADRLQLTVSDDGDRGAVPDPVETAALEMARYRARALGATLEIERRAGATTVAWLTCTRPSR